MAIESALILHGKPKAATLTPENPPPHERHWFGYARRELVARGIAARSLLMPNPANPVYMEWRDAVAGERIDERTTLIGHSAGAGFWMRYLRDNPDAHVGALVMVAPWLNSKGAEGKYPAFDVAQGLRRELGRQCERLILFHSSLDTSESGADTERVREVLAGQLEDHDIPEYRHYMRGNSMPDEKFPELIAALMNE
jgi:pimeloyl-ACP methyl ester carboxylesterase